MVERHALLIDTIGYASLPNFQYSRGSASELASALKDREIGDYAVTTLVGYESNVITPDMISAAISDHFRTATAESELLLYLSGHLLTDGTADGLHLGLTDTVAEEVVETGYPLLSLRTALDETRARRVVILLDGYYSTPMRGVSLESKIASIFGQFGRPSALHFAMLFSLLEVGLPDSDDRPPSFPWGVKEGVRGAADLDGDGVVTVTDLRDYLIQFLDQPPGFISNSDPKQLKVSTVPPPPGEDVDIDPCPNCSTDGGHTYRVPVRRSYIHYLVSPGPPKSIAREFRVVFRCPVNDKLFAVTLRLQEDPKRDPIWGVGDPLLRPSRTGE